MLVIVCERERERNEGKKITGFKKTTKEI